MGRAAKLKALKKAELRLDLGCGTHKREGFHGVDAIAFDGVDTICDLTKAWPWKDGAVSEAHCSHFLEHLTPLQRCHFANELYRVLAPNATCQIIVPHWASCRAYGDPTHQWPPVSEMWFYYIRKDWRAQNAPHTDAQHLKGGFACDFEAAWGYAMHESLLVKNQEYQQFALQNYKEAAQDLMATLRALK